MSIFFGILFMLGGLALAVLLGIVLYRDPKKEATMKRSEAITARP